MAKRYDTDAYDLSRFEIRGSAVPKEEPVPERQPRPQRENKILEIPQEHYDVVQKIRRRGKNRRAVRRVILMIIGATICLMMIFGQVRLAELTEQIESASKELEEAQSLYTQYQMKSDSQLSPAAIEKYATEKLGMIKAEQTQVEYVELSSNDKGEVLQEEDANWVASTWNYIVRLLS